MRRKVAIIGTEDVAAEWAARFLVMGWQVAITKPAPMNLDEILNYARRSLPGLYDVPLPPEGQLTQSASMAKAVSDVDWVVDASRGDLTEKARLYRYIHAVNPQAIIAANTNETSVKKLQEATSDATRVLVTVPSRPVYLLPLVEVLKSPANTPDVKKQVRVVLTDIGLYPMFLNAPVAERLSQALLEEAASAVESGVITEDGADDIVRYGLGLSWAQLGMFGTKRVLSRGAPYSSIQQHNDALVSLMRTLKKPFNPENAIAAGALVRNLERRKPIAKGDITKPLLTYARKVPAEWGDYNGHMTEACYLTAFAHGTDRFMEMIGCDAEYIANEKSFFTVETHIRHLDEIKVGADISVRTQVLEAEGKKMHLWHELYVGQTLKATAEHMLVHVDLRTRQSCLPEPQVEQQLSEIWAHHKTLARPDGAGRSVGAKK